MNQFRNRLENVSEIQKFVKDNSINLEREVT